MTQFTGVEPYILWHNAFSEQELDAIIAHGDSLQLTDARVKGEDSTEGVHRVRSTKIAFFDPNSEIKWLYEKVADVASTLNRQTYRFEIGGMERFQYTVYNTGGQDHYDWHMDQGATQKPRKLSLVLQLSSPTDYEGCDLQMQPSARIETMPRERGTLIAFPSYIVHRVTPIRSGIRRSLVMWCSGPRFR